MREIVKTYKSGFKPVQCKIRVQVLKPCSIQVVAYDPDRINTEYYRKNDTCDAPCTLDFHIRIPVTKDNVSVIIFTDLDEEVNNVIRVDRFDCYSYAPDFSGLNGKDKEFVKFIMNFCMECGYMPAGFSYKDNGFDIRYMEFIPLNGGVHPTPARIHKTDDFIEVSKMHFNKMPVPRRFAILLHEYSHNFKNSNPDSEEEADLWAARIYRQCGFPRMEFLYAFSKMFVKYEPGELEKLMENEAFRQAYEANAERLNKVYNYLYNNNF